MRASGSVCAPLVSYRRRDGFSMLPSDARVGVCVTSRNGTLRSGRDPATYTFLLAGNPSAGSAADTPSLSITLVIAASSHFGAQVPSADPGGALPAPALPGSGSAVGGHYRPLSPVDRAPALRWYASWAFRAGRLFGRYPRRPARSASLFALASPGPPRTARSASCTPPTTRSCPMPSSAGSL